MTPDFVTRDGRPLTGPDGRSGAKPSLSDAELRAALWRALGEASVSTIANHGTPYMERLLAALTKNGLEVRRV